MAYAEVWTSPDMDGMGYAGKAHYIYMCESCKSQQDVDISTGKITRHSFHIGKFQLVFRPESEWYKFGIEDCSDEYHGPENILELNLLPTYLTPQNTSEERIKLFLLFS